jgi:galactokinase
VKRYGRSPAFIARAPGRVNLIGEHIDYALFGVFPTAVEPDILIACAPRLDEHGAGHVRTENLDGKYAAQAFAPALHAEEWQLDIDKSQLRWESYVKAGYYVCNASIYLTAVTHCIQQGVLNHFFPPSASGAQPVPLDMLVTGSVPAGSGLSSSYVRYPLLDLVFNSPGCSEQQWSSRPRSRFSSRTASSAP